VNEKSGWVVGDKGTILHSVTSGVTWNAVTTPATESLFGVSFVSEAKGWVVGARGAIWFTEDGGSTWHFQPTNTMSWLEDVKFIDDLHGVAVGSNGTILRTEDGERIGSASTGTLRSGCMRLSLSTRCAATLWAPVELFFVLTMVELRGGIWRVESMRTFLG